MLKKTLGISRNKHDALVQSRIHIFKKKNRFKYVNKNQDSITQNEINPNPDQLLCETTRNSSSSQNSYEYHGTCVQLCEQVKDLLHKVSDINADGIVSEISLQFVQIERDTKEGLEHLQLKQISSERKNILKAEKNLNQIRSMKGKSLTQEKYYRNMQMSLAHQIRQASKQLRNQQKQYFQRLKTYEKGTINNAIQLNTEDRQKMRGGDDFEMFVTDEQVNQNDQKNLRIQQLVKSINQLTSVYRDLNQLVIHQGSLIDRIDFNIEETLVHIQKGNQHLKSADQWASNKYATKCIIFLMSAILILAVVLGFKYSSDK